MSTFIIYLIKANIALTLFYLAYRFGLRRLTFYTLNRWFLLTGIFISAFFPLINLNTFFGRHEHLAESINPYAVDWNALQQKVIQQQSMTIWGIAQYIFWAGVMVMGIRFLIQLFSLLKLHLQTSTGKINRENIRITTGNINPFSFFKNIYINPALHTPEELQTILAHEKIHVGEWHTLDILTGEINNIFYWFNPGAWLIKSAIRENLEFITDRALLKSGIDAKNYQYNLLKTVSGLQHIQLVNNFNLSHLKNRIIMMNKNKSSKRHILRYIFLIPVVAGVTILFTASVKQHTTKVLGENNLMLKNSSLAQGRIDTISPIPPHASLTLPHGTITDLAIRNKDTAINKPEFYKRNPSVKMMAILHTPKKDTTIYIHLENGNEEMYHWNNSKEVELFKQRYGALPTPKPEAFSFVQQMPEFPGGQIDLRQYIHELLVYPKEAKEKNVEGLVIVQFIVQKDGSLTDIKTTGKKIGYGIDEEAVNIVANMPKWNPGKQDGKVVPVKYALPIRFQLNSEKENNMATPIGKDNEQAKKALEFLKNKNYTEAENYATKALRLNPDNKPAKNILRYVHQIEEYQKKKAQYHEKVDNAKYPVEYTPPKVVKDSTINPILRLKKDTNINNPLYIIDGQETDKDRLQEIAPQEIQSIGVLKDKKATDKYGDKGKDGVIIITTKEYAKKHPQELKMPEQTKFHQTKKPLFIIDNQETDSTILNKIPPQDIQRIEVLKDKKATDKYGDKGKDGVIIITTKEYAKKHPEKQR